MKRIVFIAFLGVGLWNCSPREIQEQDLPILGRFEVDEVSGDTTFHQIADFAMYDQDSNLVTNSTFSDKIYIADFFFTTCPDICPKMKTQMLRVYEKYKNEPRVMILSHTIDPKHDTPEVLKEFSNQLGVNNEKWMFVTAEKDIMYKLGQTSYMASMAEGGESGFIHSGRFFLVDKDRQIRGAYDGTGPEEVDYLLVDIDRLLNE